MRSRAEAVNGLREMFRVRAHHELLAAMALAQLAKIDWQDALDLYGEATDAELGQLTERMAGSGDETP